MELTDRKREILKEVISRYIATGEPVGSKSVMQHLKKSCSSATIRNEMADLEEMGLLSHPHTSAGRTPTTRGYRLYVDSLMESYSLDFEERLLLQAILSEKDREKGDLLRDVTRLLARMTGCTVLAFAREGVGTIERFEGIYVNPGAFALVMITSQGRAVTRQLSPEVPLDRAGMERIIDVLNESLAKKELGALTVERLVALEKDLGDYRFFVAPLIRIIYQTIGQLGSDEVCVAGIANLLAWPEFSQPETARAAVAELEEPEKILERFLDPFPTGLRVHVGGGGKGLDEASFVLCPFRMGKGLSGAVCIVGPKRMDYAGAIAHLEYLSRQMGAARDFSPTLPLIENEGIKQ